MVPLMLQKQIPLGTYLVEAGLLTLAQVEVALNDQLLMTHMRFGDVLVARGWIKQQTIDFLMQKLIEPERQAAKEQERKEKLARAALLESRPTVRQTSFAPSAKDTWGNERKALRSQPAEDGVSWVG
jgi:hypothetical protein